MSFKGKSSFFVYKIYTKFFGEKIGNSIFFKDLKIESNI